MLNQPPTFEFIRDGEISDAAIEAMARLLLSLVEQGSSAPEVEDDAKSA